MLHARKTPGLHPNWIDRHPDTKQILWFQNLKDLHALTLEWVSDLKVGTLHQWITKSVPAESTKQVIDWVWHLEMWSDPSRELFTLIDDLSIHDYLATMESYVKQIQAWVLTSSLIASQNSREERKITLSRLEQASWRVGRATGENRWHKTKELADWSDLKVSFLSSLESPLHPHLAADAYLIHRLTSEEISLELLDCAHTRSEYTTTQFPFSNELCVLHSHWLKGFAYSLSPMIRIEQRNGDQHSPARRCTQIWTKR